MRSVRLLIVACLCVGLAGCYGRSSDVTASGKGKPTLAVEFPATVAPGETADLVLEVSNPGPGDMDSVFVAFAQVGVPGSGIGNPLIPLSTGRENPSVAGIEPRPESVSEDGSVYRFPGLTEGSSTTITFSVVAPRTRGPAANSVQVYDGSDVDRGTGKRVSTIVEG